jgi:hypothetical protein
MAIILLIYLQESGELIIKFVLKNNMGVLNQRRIYKINHPANL